MPSITVAYVVTAPPVSKTVMVPYAVTEPSGSSGAVQIPYAVTEPTPPQPTTGAVVVPYLVSEPADGIYLYQGGQVVRPAVHVYAGGTVGEVS